MMTMTLMKSTTLVLSTIMIYMRNPVKVSMILLILSMAIFVSLSSDSGQIWFPTLFLMIFMGGILMMFMILSSISPNEKSIKMNFMMTPILLGYLLTLYNQKLMENSEIQKFTKSFLETGGSFSTMILILILYFFSSITMLCKNDTSMRNLSCRKNNLIL